MNSNKKIGVRFDILKAFKTVLLVAFATTILFVGTAEIYFSIFNPQPYLYPRLSYSEKYRKIPPKNAIIEHCNPPHIKHYRTNANHFRGRAVPISNKYGKANIILLGDSYTFGIGVNDGEEYADIMAEKLKEEYQIINTGVGGWGLTQQIRVFYEFGQLYHPEIVVLLFCGNDPSDNIKDNCTRVENDRFSFRNFDKKDNLSIYRMNKMLSRSVIQKSNLYNILINNFWNYAKGLQIRKVNNELEDGHKKMAKINLEKNYNELINCFAHDLKEKNIEFLFLSVNSYKNGKKIYAVDSFPLINDNIKSLESLGLIDFVEINKWFREDDFKKSPVGHYDKQWNKVLGCKLAEYIKSNCHKIQILKRH